MSILSLLLALIFMSLGAVHFYWALGGSWGIASTLPTKVNGQRVLNPKKVDSFIVGAVLMAFALFYIVRSGLVPHQLPSWAGHYIGWIIPAIFILRAIGDFTYVGFFKRIKSTDFARADNRFFSPLCLGIGVLGVVVQTTSVI